MAMHRVPTLILGIGGIGCRIAANISDLLSPEARERVGIIGFDTNVNDLSAIAKRGVRTVQTSDSRTVGEYLQHHPECLPWFPINHFTAAKSLLNGAGQIRAVSRLGALAAEERGDFAPIKEEIQRIRANRGDGSSGNLTVMVVGSITGGTGAGLFLQLPYYVRKVMYGEAGINNIIIRGMFMGPDFTADVQPSSINAQAVRVNGYACLKELNAVYLRQLCPDIGNLNVDFYSPTSPEERDRNMRSILRQWDLQEHKDTDYNPSEDIGIISQSSTQIPYDYLYLLERSNADGSVDQAELANIEGLAARMVHTLMFTPVSNNALSVEDNMILQDAAHNGMNRYSSAGMCRLVYPCELAREYVTLCCVRDLVKEEWMLIDDAHDQKVKQARAMQRTDSKAVIPEIGTSYIEKFIEEVGSEGKLGKLADEVYIGEKLNRRIRSEVYLAGISSGVTKLLENDQSYQAALNSCTIRDNSLMDFKKASSDISVIENNLEEFEKLATQYLNEKAPAIANKLFPANWDSLRFSKEDSGGIYELLHKVHPISARFLCYSAIKQLQENVAKLEKGSVARKENLDDYENADFNQREEGQQNALIELQRIKKKQIPIISALTSDASKLTTLREDFRSNVQTQVENICTYVTEGLKLSVSRILLTRFERLAENYATFFRSIDSMIQDNHTRIAILEDINMPTGQKGVYCSKEAFQQISAEYQNAINNDLPAETKTAIFEDLFKVLSDDFEHDNAVETERQKAAYAAGKGKKLAGIFQTAVVDTIRTSVVKQGAGIIDMSILEALRHQYELDFPGEEGFDDYLRKTVNSCMDMAMPLISADGKSNAEATATAYLAMHPSCAATELGVPHVGATQAMYAPSATSETGNVKVTAILDEEFSPYELTCFRAKYKLPIEDLVKYKPTSENCEAYEKRIGALGKVPERTGNPDDSLTVINPHLDRYWHEEAYLPSIYKSERDASLRDTYKAFIYGLGYGLFQILDDEATIDADGKCRKFWYFDRSEKVKTRNSPIGVSYGNLFDAIPFNSRMKKAILAEAREKVLEAKGTATPQVLQQGYRSDKLLSTLSTAKSTAFQPEPVNILNIFLDMYYHMDDATAWRLLFTCLLEVLWEYCEELYENNARLVNMTTRAVLQDMWNNCGIAKKSESDRTRAEDALMAIYEDLLKKQYVHR